MEKRVHLLFVSVFLALVFQACDSDEKMEKDWRMDAMGAESHSTSDQPGAALHAEGNYFRDQQGRTVILRGVNLAGNSKVPPFMPITEASMLDPLPAWGFNTLRFLFTWEAFEPTRGDYNEDYLEYYEQVIKWADERGLYVIVDFHQDAFSRFSIDGCGEGFPEWAVTPEVEHKTPDNGESCSGWGTKMIFDLSHHKTWEHFHNDKYGARTGFLNMLGAVADRLSQYPNVIGYEIINEPWGTDDELLSLYEDAGTRIRSRHPSAILFVPPHALVSGGMSDNNIPKPGFGNFAYSPHYYDGSIILFHSWFGSSPDGALNKLLNKANDWQTPMFLGEFGGPEGAGNVEGYLKAIYDWLDKYWVSCAQWCYTPGWRDDIKDGWNMEDFSIIDDQGNLRNIFVPRPYPQKIAGTPGEFQVEDNGFRLSWNHDPNSGNTEIYLPAHYADGKEVHLTLPSGIEGTYDIDGQSLVCTISRPGEVQLTLSIP